MEEEEDGAKDRDCEDSHMLKFFDQRRKTREEKRMLSTEKEKEEDVLDQETVRGLSERQKQMLESMKEKMDKGIFDHQYQERSYTKAATPFMFPDAFSVNQQVFGHHSKQKNAVQQRAPTILPGVNARQVHREQFWTHLNREEILLHDHSSWQKLA